MKIRSILLGTAAALLSSGAFAADLLPAPVAASGCDAYGAQYFSIGGNTCLRVGGDVRFRATYTVLDSDSYDAPTVDGDKLKIEKVDGGEKLRDDLDFAARGRVYFDARSATEWGTLRSYIRVNGTDGDASVDLAYLQIAGLTAGRATSYMIREEQDPTTLLAYTASLGSGMSLTVSLEDTAEQGVVTGVFTEAGTGGIAGAANAKNAVVTSSANPDGGRLIPDIVARLDAEFSGWSVSVGAAGHQSNYHGFTGAGNVVTTATDDLVNAFGFAVGAAVSGEVAQGITLSADIVYASGASAYTGASADFVMTSAADGAPSLEAVNSIAANVGIDFDVSSDLSVSADVDYMDTMYDNYVAGDTTVGKIGGSVGLDWTPVAGFSVEVDVGVDNNVVRQYYVSGTEFKNREGSYMSSDITIDLIRSF